MLRNETSTSWSAYLGLALVTVVSLIPLVLPFPEAWIDTRPLGLEWLAKAFVVAAMLASIVWLDQQTASPTPRSHLLFLMGIAMLMTACHWVMIDRHPQLEAWQRGVYFGVLRFGPDAEGFLYLPHVFRPLPYGFVRSLEWLTGDWHFAGSVYRWFFSFWFVWGWYRFVGHYVSLSVALASLGLAGLYYPLSIARYYGQLTDPMSHAFFVLALVALIEDRWVWMGALLVVGVFAKETAVLLVPVYFVCYWRRGLRTWGICLLLGLGCTLAFLATRVPLGWGPNSSLTDVPGSLTLWNNLGLSDEHIWSSVPVYERYLHPLFYLLPVAGVLVWRWKLIPHQLRIIAIVLTPLLLGVNLAVGWSYESRNYFPMMPVLAAMLAVVLTPAREEKSPQA